MKCPHCKLDFFAPIARGLHLWERRGRGRCATPEEMEKAGWYKYCGQWLTSKPAWVDEEAPTK